MKAAWRKQGVRASRGETWLGMAAWGGGQRAASSGQRAAAGDGGAGVGGGGRRCRPGRCAREDLRSLPGANGGAVVMNVNLVLMQYLDLKSSMSVLTCTVMYCH